MTRAGSDAPVRIRPPGSRRGLNGVPHHGPAEPGSPLDDNGTRSPSGFGPLFVRCPGLPSRAGAGPAPPGKEVRHAEPVLTPAAAA